MKLDPGMHIGMHLVFFGKSGVTPSPCHPCRFLTSLLFPTHPHYPNLTHCRLHLSNLTCVTPTSFVVTCVSPSLSSSAPVVPSNPPPIPYHRTHATSNFTDVIRLDHAVTPLPYTSRTSQSFSSCPHCSNLAVVVFASRTSSSSS
jgi:hypothetical protein